MAARNIYVADFETTTDPLDCRVWAYGICPLTDSDNVDIGLTVDDFTATVWNENAIVYFHNLKFDGTFIIDHLFTHGYKWVEKNPRAGQFTTLISKMGQFYNMNVVWFNGHKTEFRDSLKKLPMSVSRVAESFRLDESKGDLDYDAPREIGHNPTDEERDYIRRDVSIIAKALKIQLDNSQGKLTIGADALAEYKKIIGTRTFTSLFPILDVDIDCEIRSAYRGGWTYVKHDRKATRQPAGKVYDVNSLYPSVMYANVLPWGAPVATPIPEPTETYPLFITSITFTASLKKNHLPCIQIKGASHFSETEYVTEIVEPITLSVTNVDLKLWLDHYDMNILSYNGAYGFKGMTGLFTKYIDKWNAVKMQNKGGLREIAKLHLNSLYGKFATNPDVTGKYPEFIANTVKFTTGKESTRSPVYTAMGAFITAYARDYTIRAAQANYDTFAYADTDSLHLITGITPSLDIDAQRMGAWKHEYDFSEAFYARAKAYSEHKASGEWETRIAGLPRNVAASLTIDDFTPGRTFAGKLAPRYVPGGVVLANVDYTLNM